MVKKNSFSGSVLQGAGLAVGAVIVIVIISVFVSGIAFDIFGKHTDTDGGTSEPVYVSGVLIAKGSNVKVNDTIYVSSDLVNWEPVTPSNGAWTTSATYNMSSTIYVFHPGGSYYATLQSFTVPTADTAKTTVSIGLVFLIKASTSMTVSAQTTGGTSLGTSASAWLNTTSGTKSSIRVIVQNSDPSTGFGDSRWPNVKVTDIGTFRGYTNLPTDKDTYVGPLAVITVNTSSVVVSGALSSINIGTTYYYFVMLNPTTLWNDENVADDGIQVSSFDVLPNGDATITYSIYDNVRSDFLKTVSLGSPDASTSFKVNV